MLSFLSFHFFRCPKCPLLGDFGRFLTVFWLMYVKSCDFLVLKSHYFTKNPYICHGFHNESASLTQNSQNYEKTFKTREDQQGRISQREVTSAQKPELDFPHNVSSWLFQGQGR